MGEPKALPAHPLAGNPNAARPGDRGWEEGAVGSNAPKTKLIFDLPRGRNSAAQRKWADANPFEALNGEDDASNFLRKAPEAPKGDWIFQGKKEVRNTLNSTILFSTH